MLCGTWRSTIRTRRSAATRGRFRKEPRNQHYESALLRPLIRNVRLRSMQIDLAREDPGI